MSASFPMLALLLAFIIAAVTSSDSSGQPPASQQSKDVVVTEKMNNESVIVAKDGTVVIKLPVQLGTGYSWRFAMKDDRKFKPLGQPTFEKPADAKPGGEEIQVFKVRALSAGESELKLEYVRPFEKDQKAAKEFKFKVRVQ